MGGDGSDQATYFTMSMDYLKFLFTCVSIYGIGYYRLSASWVLLGSLGYFLVKQAKSRSSRLISSIKAIGENEKKFILQNFSVRDLPSWVYFPDVERAEWFNKVIKRMWPYISEYAREIIIETVEPAISRNLPKALKPFSFAKIDLGDTPPRIGGVKVYTGENIGRDEIVLDLDLMLYSDARIKVNLGKVAAGVKQFELRGTLRVVMKPLVSKVPFAGAVTVCFLDSPFINFTLTDMGNILGLPGLQQTLDTVIRNVVNQLVVLPNRLPVQLVSDVDIQRLKYPLPQGLLRIQVIAGRKLKAGDKNIVGQGSSDPYCVVRVGARTFTTSVIKGTLEPVWDEHFEAVVDICHGQSVSVEVYDKDQGNKDDYLGCTSVPIESVLNRSELDVWLALEGVKTGSIHLRLCWYEMSNDPSNFPQALEKALEYGKSCGRTMSSGFLYVAVQHASNLMHVKQLQEPSPFCNLQLGRDCQATEVKEHTPNPVWDSVHHFLIGDPTVDVLQIIIRDNRTEIKLGSCNIPVKMLLSQRLMCVEQPFTLQDSGRDTSTIYLRLQLMALVPGKPQISDISDSFKTTTILNNSANVLQSNIPPSPTLSLKQIEQSSKTDSFPSQTPTADLSPTKTLPTEILQSDLHSIETNQIKTPESTVRQRNPANVVTSSPTRLSPSLSEISDKFTKQAEEIITKPKTKHGSIMLSYHYTPSISCFEITVHEARDLIGVDKDGLADPYVKLCFVDQHDTIIGEPKRTKVIKDNLNPVFQETFEFPLDLNQIPRATLKLEVKNHVGRFTLSGRTHFMGSLNIDLNTSLSMNTQTKWFDLLPADGFK